MALMPINAATVFRFTLVRENCELEAREAEAERSGRRIGGSKGYRYLV